MRARLLIVAAAVLCAGCLRATTLITVRPDGSGTIDQEIGMTALAADLARGLRDEAAKEGGADNDKKPFTEADARRAAGQMGVRFVSGEPIKTAELEGYRARYAFDDVTKLTLDKDASGTPSPAGPAGSTVPPYGFEFTKGAAGATLIVIMPPLDSAKMGGGLGVLTGRKPSSAEMEQAVSMMKMMMRGTFVDVTIAVEGTVRKANVPMLGGNRVTLVQVDFDKLLDDPAGMEKLDQARDAKSLQNIPGIKIPDVSKLTIEFAR